MSAEKMMKGSATRYEARHGGGDDRQEAADVRSAAARQCVRQLRLHNPLSSQWLSLVDSLEQLSRLAQLESLMPADSKTSEMWGRIENSDGTLWDQDAHEDAIRILVEEAKVNLCLRMMNTFKEWQYNTELRTRTYMDAMKNSAEYDEFFLDKKCTTFEESLGLLLLRGFMHVETLQLTDLPLLIDHITMVLKYAATHSGKSADVSGAGSAGYSETLKSQENVVVYYFSALMKHAEALNNSEVLWRIMENDVIHRVCEHVLLRKDDYALDFLGVAVEGFAKLADNEDFQVDYKNFFQNPEQRKKFLELEAVYGTILERYPEKRSELRPLSDFFKKLKKM